MVFQSNWSCLNQFQPKRLVHDPSMTVILKVRSTVCKPYSMNTFTSLATGIASPVYVVNNSDDLALRKQLLSSFI